jgi:hypothetical protein
VDEVPTLTNRLLDARRSLRQASSFPRPARPASRASRWSGSENSGDRPHPTSAWTPSSLSPSAAGTTASVLIPVSPRIMLSVRSSSSARCARLPAPPSGVPVRDAMVPGVVDRMVVLRHHKSWFGLGAHGDHTEGAAGVTRSQQVQDLRRVPGVVTASNVKPITRLWASAPWRYCAPRCGSRRGTARFAG